MTFGFAFPLRHLAYWLALGLALVAAAALALRLLERGRAGRMNRFVAADLAPPLLPGFDAKVRRPLVWLTVLGLSFGLVALAQPRWGQAWQEVRKQSHDIVICIDTSKSMRAENPLPNRMERARQKLFTLLDRAPADRFAIVAFAGAAALQCPLTHDHGYLKSVLSAIDTDTISARGTDIAAAIDEAARLFEEEAAQGGEFNRDSRAILLLSDGEQISGDAVEAAERAARYARVYVIGIGDPAGAEVTVPEVLRGRPGVTQTHVSRLDEDTLIRIAQAGQGVYIRTTPDNTDIEQIHSEIQRLTARTVGSDVRMRLVNRYQWFLLLAILCFAGEGAWRVVLPWVRRWRVHRETSGAVRGEAEGRRQNA